MGIDPEEFFGDVQGAAVLKHGVLRRYLAVFTSKVGSTARDGKVFYLDAYAGPGEYQDGGEGSPAVARATAENLAKTRNLVGVYCEKNKENRAKLERFLGGTAHAHHILAGEIEENFDEVLKLVGDAPLIAFYDPFGLSAPMAQLKDLMNRPNRDRIGHYATTELIINVSYTGIARNCGAATSDMSNPSEKWAKSQPTFVKRCNERLGGDWWQEIAQTRPDDWVQKIAHGYAKQVKTQTGAGWMRAPVRDRPDGPVAYELLLVTRYTDEAHWHFHEQLSLANQDWRAFTSAQAAQQAQQALPINVDDDEEQWVTAIKENICKLLAKGEFTVRAKWAEVYGRTFSLARGMHVRKAIKQLFAEGVTLCNGKKDGKRDLPDLVITRGPKAPPLNE